MEKQNKTSRTLQAEAMKTKLRDIVFNMVQEKPLDKIKITDIAKEAEISVGNFYQYFSCKEEALIYSYKVKDAIWKTLEFEKIDDPMQRLQKILATHLYAMTENSLCFDTQLYISQLKIYEEYFFTKDRYLHQIVRDTIAEAQNMGLMKTTHTAEELRIRLLNFSRGLVYNYCIEHEEDHERFLAYAYDCLGEYLSMFVENPESIDLRKQNVG